MIVLICLCLKFPSLAVPVFRTVKVSCALLMLCIHALLSFLFSYVISSSGGHFSLSSLSVWSPGIGICFTATWSDPGPPRSCWQTAASQPYAPVSGCYPTLVRMQLLKILPKLLPSEFSYIILMGAYVSWNTVLRKGALIELYALFDLPFKSKFIIQISCVMENRCRPAEGNCCRVGLLLFLLAFPSERKHKKLFFFMSSCIVQVLEFKFENHSS